MALLPCIDRESTLQRLRQPNPLGPLPLPVESIECKFSILLFLPLIVRSLFFFFYHSLLGRIAERLHRYHDIPSLQRSIDDFMDSYDAELEKETSKGSLVDDEGFTLVQSG